MNLEGFPYDRQAQPSAAAPRREEGLKHPLGERLRNSWPLIDHRNLAACAETPSLHRLKELEPDRVAERTDSVPDHHVAAVHGPADVLSPEHPG